MPALRHIVIALVATIVLAPAAPALAKKPQHHRKPASVLNPPGAVYGFGVPAPYPYGWFGTEYRTRRYCQTGYYGYYYEKGYWQGYW